MLQFQATVFKAGTQMLAHGGADALLRAEPAGSALAGHVQRCEQVSHAGLGWALLGCARHLASHPERVTQTVV